MTALIRALERLLGQSHSVLPNQEHGKLECPVGIAAPVGANVCRGGTIDVALLLQQHTEFRCGVGVTALIRTREGVFGLGQPALGEQEHPEAESGVRYAALIGAAIRRLGASRCRRETRATRRD